MTAAPSDCSHAAISYPGETGNLAAALSFRCVAAESLHAGLVNLTASSSKRSHAAKSFYNDKAFLTVHPCFREATAIFI